MCNILYKIINYNDRFKSERKENFLKSQKHEQSYIKDGNIASGLLLRLEKMFNCD